MLAPESTAVPKTTLSDKGHVHKDAKCDCIKAVQHKLLKALYIILFFKINFYLYVCVYVIVCHKYVVAQGDDKNPLDPPGAEVTRGWL